MPDMYQIERDVQEPIKIVSETLQARTHLCAGCLGTNPSQSPFTSAPALTRCPAL
jgi:hypothetical protein